MSAGRNTLPRPASRPDRAAAAEKTPAAPAAAAGLAQNLTRAAAPAPVTPELDARGRPVRPLTPKEFAAAFEELTGVSLSVRWVQLSAQRGDIPSVGAGRAYIYPREVRALAARYGLELATA